MDVGGIWWTVHDVSGAHILLHVVQVIVEEEETLVIWDDRLVAFCDCTL